ncbi:hypothetical protein B0H10DRAFT_1032698 [Mycena sp. CBHHK59/15]|nr:hypothetical protein B0H10DRAFT_1032698 [Mycena sp. CBHHK59/15]
MSAPGLQPITSLPPVLYLSHHEQTKLEKLIAKHKSEIEKEEDPHLKEEKLNELQEALNSIHEAQPPVKEHLRLIMRRILNTTHGPTKPYIDELWKTYLATSAKLKCERETLMCKGNLATLAVGPFVPALLQGHNTSASNSNSSQYPITPLNTARSGSGVLYASPNQPPLYQGQPSNHSSFRSPGSIHAAGPRSSFGSYSLT